MNEPSGRSGHFLESERIHLREVRLSDVNERYRAWLNDPVVTEFLEIRYTPHSLEDIRKFVEAMDGKADEIFLAICLNDGGRHIGNIKLGPINRIHRFADVSLLIGERDCWRAGYATEAIRALTAFAFNVLNLNKLRAGCYSANRGSEKAFLKAGFRREGLLKNHWIVGGAFQDEVLMGLWQADWRSHA
jgi:RimJ/RimL family protein N-acetyltransferase